MSEILLIAVLAFPGIWAYVAGRLFRQTQDEPLGPELWLKHQARGVFVLIGSVACATALAGEKPMAWMWCLLAPYLSLLAGHYPATKARAGATWTFGAYMSHAVRFGVALGFTPVFLLMVPVAMDSVSVGSRWTMAGAVMAVWLAWSAGAGRWMALLAGARPIDDPALRERFAAIVARSGVPAPAIRRADTPQGLWPNACAISGTGTQSWVLMGSTLLDGLSPDESAAIFAHEVAHLEHFRAGAALRVAGLHWLMLAVGLTGMPVLEWLGLTSSLVPIVLVWMNLMLLGLAYRQVGGKHHEAESDARAVALCGDAEALIRGLTKIHVMAGLPRRWDTKLDGTATHPSLARRIQAIRQVAGLVTPPPATDIVVPAARPGSYLVFAPGSLLVLEDAPGGTAPDVAALRACAKVQRSWAYDKLRHVGVALASGQAPVLDIVEADGAALQVRLRPDTVGAVQQALDGVDGLLATKPARTAPPPWQLFIAVCTLVCLASLDRLVPFGGVGLAILAAWRPTASLLFATAAALLGGALLTVPKWLWGHGEPAWAGLLVAAAVGVFFAVLAVRQARSAPPSAGRPKNVAPGLALAVLLLSAFPLPWPGDAAALREYGVAPIATGWQLFAVAAWLWFRERRPRWARPVAAAALIPAGLILFWTSPWNVAGRIQDPFRAGPPTVRWHDLAQPEEWPWLVDRAFHDLELAPAGDAVLLVAAPGSSEDSAADDGLADDESSASVGFRTRSFTWCKRDGRRQVLEVVDARILDGEQVLVLRGTNGQLALEQLALGEVTPRTLVRQPLPAWSRARLATNAATQTWRVCQGKSGRHRTCIQGSLGGAPSAPRRLTVDRQGMFALAGDGSGGLLIAPDVNDAYEARSPWLLSGVGTLLFHPPRTGAHIWHVNETGRSGAVLATLPAWAYCEDAPLGSRRFLCTSHALGDVALAWLEPLREKLLITPLARVSRAVPLRYKAGADGSVGWSGGKEIVWFDGQRGIGARLSTAKLGQGEDDGSDARTLLALAPSRLAVAVHARGGWRLWVFRTP